MRVRRIAVAAALSVAVTVPSVATMNAAFAAKPSPKPSGTAAPKPSEAPKPTASAKPTEAPKPTASAKPGAEPTSKPAKPTKPVKPVKPVKKVKFAASGTVAAVDVAARTVSVVVKGGTKDVRQTTVVVGVPATARIVVNGKGRALADVAAGFRITVTGLRAGTVYTAEKIEARGTKPSGGGTPAPTASPAPSESPATPAPSETPETPEPSETPEAPEPDESETPDA